MSIHVSSLLRVNLTFADVDEAGAETPIDLDAITEKSVRIVKPDGTEVASPALVVDDATAGEAHWITEDEDVLDQAGTWKVQGIADGYKSAPVSFRVSGNP